MLLLTLEDIMRQTKTYKEEKFFIITSSVLTVMGTLPVSLFHCIVLHPTK
jgi:hypothetical protein